MTIRPFLRSGPGRVVRVVVGMALVYYGATHPSLLGLVLMMVGIVPAVTGCAGICLLDVVKVTREPRRVPQHRPHAGRV